MTKAELVAQFEKDYPTLHIGNDEDGYRDMTKAEYDALIDQWADNTLADNAEQEKKAAAKQAILDKLGITAEEAAQLLG
jgi:hypothetical protein